MQKYFLVTCLVLSSYPSLAKLNHQEFIMPRTDDLLTPLISPYVNQGFDLKANFDHLQLLWPIKDSKQRVLSVFESPDVNNIQVTDENNRPLSFKLVIPHLAVDIARSNVLLSSKVYAPIAGYATVLRLETLSDPPLEIFDFYETLVAIYDPQSHAIVALLHLQPQAKILESTTPVWVDQGEVIGNLSPDVPCNYGLAQEYMHTHVFLVDASDPQHLFVKNPFPYLRDIVDTLPPRLEKIYVLDSTTHVNSHLVDGEIDVVAQMYDQYDGWPSKIPVAQLSYSITSNDGKILAQAENCLLEKFFYDRKDEPAYKSFINLYDLWNTFLEASDVIWPSNTTPASQMDRQYRIVLTHLKKTQTSSCELVGSDDEGFIKINAEDKQINVNLLLKDVRGNQSQFLNFALQKPAGL